MARLKAIARSAFEDRSPRFLLVTIALAVVIALLAGVGIGYKADTGTSRPAKKSAKHSTQKKQHRQPATRKAAPLLIGTVATRRPRKIVVLQANGKAVQVGLGRKLRVAIAKPDKPSSI